MPISARIKIITKVSKSNDIVRKTCKGYGSVVRYGADVFGGRYMAISYDRRGSRIYFPEARLACPFLMPGNGTGK